METSTKNLNFEFIDDPTLEDFTNGTIDFVFNGRTHKIYKQILSPEDDYCIHCIKDKTKVISTFMTLDLRHSLDYLATKEEIVEPTKEELDTVSNMIAAMANLGF